MRKIISLLILCFVTGSYASGREVRTFNDGWEFKKTDRFPNNLNEGWQPVTIPHTWNDVDMQMNRNSFYEGPAYYRKTFAPDAGLAGKRLYLRFEGVGSVCEVYVNGKFAGNHKGAYSAFAIEITNLLEFGVDNTIAVMADNTARPDVIPVNHRLFGVYGGIYRPVELIITDKVSVAVNDYASPGVYISQKNVGKKSASIAVKTKIDSREKSAVNLTLVTTIYESDGRVKARRETPVTVSPQGRNVFEQTFEIRDPHLWQGLEDPYLYRTVVRLERGGEVLDEVVQPLGIRRFELRASDGMCLNDKKVPMYGVCRHQDWLGLGSAISNAHHDADLAIIREMGATTIRLAHYQQSEYFYARCDSIGFMVWAEIPFVNSVTTREGDNAKQQLTELIRQNFNHPSIYIWGLHNEVYSPAEYTNALTIELNDLAKSEDPDRYTVSVSGYNNIDRPTNLNADIQGINHYFGWYNNRISDIVPWIEGLEKDYADYRIIFSEYGAEANIDHQQEVVSEVGDCCGFDKKYNETFATKFHEIQWAAIANTDVLIGSYIWNTFDFATPMSSQGGVEARNMKGLVTFDRKVKKDPFYWYKANWSAEPVLYLTQRRAVERENRITPVAVYSNVGKPVLTVNGREYVDYRQGTTPVHYIFEGVELREGENIVTARVIRDGITYKDSIHWNYSKDNSRDNVDPEENKKEHIGLT